MGERSVFDRLDDLERTASETREDTRKIREDTEEIKKASEEMKRAAAKSQQTASSAYGYARPRAGLRSTAAKACPVTAEFLRTAERVYVYSGEEWKMKAEAKRRSKRFIAEIVFIALEMAVFVLAAFLCLASYGTVILLAAAILVLLNAAGIVMCARCLSCRRGRQTEIPYAKYRDPSAKPERDGNGIICGMRKRGIYSCYGWVLGCADMLCAVLGFILLSSIAFGVILAVVGFILSLCIMIRWPNLSIGWKYELHFRRDGTDIVYGKDVRQFMQENGIR